jgi:hypothetical protein
MPRWKRIIACVSTLLFLLWPVLKNVHADGPRITQIVPKIYSQKINPYTGVADGVASSATARYRNGHFLNGDPSDSLVGSNFFSWDSGAAWVETTAVIPVLGANLIEVMYRDTSLASANTVPGSGGGDFVDSASVFFSFSDTDPVGNTSNWTRPRVMTNAAMLGYGNWAPAVADTFQVSWRGIADSTKSITAAATTGGGYAYGYIVASMADSTRGPAGQGQLFPHSYMRFIIRPKARFRMLNTTSQAPLLGFRMRVRLFFNQDAVQVVRQPSSLPD